MEHFIFLICCLQSLTFDLRTHHHCCCALSSLPRPLSRSPLLQGDRMDREAMKCQVLTVSNHSCESLTLVGNTLECTIPTELQTTTSKELQVEVRAGGSVHVHVPLISCSGSPAGYFCTLQWPWNNNILIRMTHDGLTTLFI